MLHARLHTKHTTQSGARLYIHYLLVDGVSNYTSPLGELDSQME